MDYHISDKMQSVKPSAIREILKYASDPSVISLAAGDPAPESLPHKEISEILSTMLMTDPMKALLYSQSEGYQPLRDIMVEFVKKYYCINTVTGNIVMTSGAQQGIDLLTKVVCNEGDTVICEAPSFVGALNTFRSYGVNLVGVEMQNDGTNLEKLEQALKTNINVRFIYIIPNFQNPTGITTTLEKRKAVYNLAVKYGVLILEDNPYGDLRFSGQSVPTLKSFDSEDIVFYTGSFSKILSSGIRLGYLISPDPLIAKITVAKQCTDVHSSMISQLICYNFLSNQDFDKHISSLIKIYKEKCELMLSLIDEHFPKSVKHTVPEGGLFIWCTLPEGIDSAVLAKKAVEEKKICIVPGNAFLVDNNAKSNCFRLNYSKVSVENIKKAIPILGELIKECI